VAKENAVWKPEPSDVRLVEPEEKAVPPAQPVVVVLDAQQYELKRQDGNREWRVVEQYDDWPHSPDARSCLRPQELCIPLGQLNDAPTPIAPPIQVS